MRFFYSLKGIGNSIYLFQTAPIVGVAFMAFLIVIYANAELKADENKRHSRQVAYMENEISERMEERRDKS